MAEERGRRKKKVVGMEARLTDTKKEEGDFTEPEWLYKGGGGASP